jgi:hypothetical protein
VESSGRATSTSVWIASRPGFAYSYWLACAKSTATVDLPWPVRVFGEVSEWLKEHAWKVCIG